MEEKAKIVIFSDNHFQMNELRTIIDRHQDADVFVHCGDSQFQPTDVIFNDVKVVKGNNDFTKFPNDLMFEVAGKKIFVTHGHLQYVYYDSNPNTRGTSDLALDAKKHGADIAFYGHTHVAECHEQEGVFILNPGSTNFPRSFSFRIPSYAVLFIDGDVLTPHFYHAKTHEEITSDIL